MRVMLFTDTYIPQVNGVATSVANLAQMLLKQGHDVMICTTSSKRSSGETLPIAYAHAIPVPRAPGLSLAPPVGLALPVAVHQFRPHLIHSHTPFGIGWQAMLASHREGIPLLGTHHSHQDVFTGYVRRTISQSIIRGVVRSLTSSYYNRCDLVACASDFLAAHMASYGVRQKILVIPNALDTTLFCPQPRSSLLDAKRGIKIVFVGRLAVDKNLHQLITMIRPVLDSDSASVSLDIIGEGPEKSHLMRFVSSQGLVEKIRFTGLLRGKELVKAISNSDICVSASLSDNQPMSLLESLACGVPVVAIDSGGVSEIIQNGYNGFLVDSSNEVASQFVCHLTQLISDTSLREFMSIHARAYVEQHNAKCLNMILDAYQETIYNASKRKSKKAYK